MTITEQNAYFVRISIGTKNIIMHLVTCLLNTGTGPNLITKDFLSTYLLSQIVESTTKTLY